MPTLLHQYSYNQSSDLSHVILLFASREVHYNYKCSNTSTLLSTRVVFFHLYLISKIIYSNDHWSFSIVGILFVKYIPCCACYRGGGVLTNCFFNYLDTLSPHDILVFVAFRHHVCAPLLPCNIFNFLSCFALLL